MSSGYKVEFIDGECIVKEVQSNTQVARIPMTSHRLFPLEADDVLAAHVVQRDEDLSTLWHRRYGHLNKRSLNYLNEHQLVDGLPTITHIQPCEACALGKQAHRAFPKGQAYRATAPLELVHGDLVGPMQTPSYGGNLYFFLLTNDFSRHSWVYFLQYKSEALQKFKVFKLAVEKQYSTPVKAFRSDRGGEFTSGAFRAFCEETGIKHQLTAPRTPQQNGVAERRNRTVTEMARTMLKDACLPTELWADAVATAVHVINRSPTVALEKLTPYEALTHRKPKVDHL